MLIIGGITCCGEVHGHVTRRPCVFAPFAAPPSARTRQQQPEQPASLCCHLQHNDELWETDLATADEDESGSGAEEEAKNANAAAGGG